MQLKGAQLRYPVHEKELLAIVRAVKKFKADLLGEQFTIYTDHRTLENFGTQKSLSRRQARWLEELSQFDMTICYIKGEDNTVADALSRLPPDDSETIPDCDDSETCNWQAWMLRGTSAAVNRASIHADTSLMTAIRDGYCNDDFCKKFISGQRILPSVREENQLWFIGSRLLIPRVGHIREDLFHLAHDVFDHSGPDKAYEILRDSFYWPNMRRDLQRYYIPGCEPCARNKSPTRKPSGPAHPLPVPDGRGSSIALDFVGPLPEEAGFNCVLTMTCRLGSDIRIVPCRTNISSEEAAALFFDHWYCENGLPDEIVADRDKLWISTFWRTLQRLSGVRLALSSSFHPETDGASERSNKSVVQSIRFYVDRAQHGWVRILPRIRFTMMNTVNASTGFSGFQLRLGRSPRVIPPLVEDNTLRPREERSAAEVIELLRIDTMEAQDSLVQAKVNQAHQMNKHRSPDHCFTEGDKVWLSTKNRRRDYLQKKKDRVAKFVPRFDGPYVVKSCHPELSTYTLEIPHAHKNACVTFHSSHLKPWTPNDDDLFPQRKHQRPGPIVTEDGIEEYFIDSIIDERRCGRGYRYLVRWVGYGPEDDEWLPGKELDECAALDTWLSTHPH
ncbi:hypothetical protein MPER_13063 [Moniliophthora perniciosa FA553]|nr:hypothetical protein MPER_13063 [Moniliophthora perniciosa FA553]